MSLPRLTIAAAGVALLVLVGYGTCPWADRPGGAPTGEPSPSEPLQDATASRAAALEARLAREAAARIQLERQVARLDERVSMLAKRLGEQPASPARPGARNQDAPREAENASARPAGPENFDGAVLLDAGFSASEAAELRARVDGITMSSLALWDRATREGWVGTPRFEEEAAAVAHGAQLEALRSDVGDEAFDWALFAAGHDNRIRVESVLAGSPAAMVGIRPGDLVVGYANEPMFTGGQLVEATTEGRAGDLVAVDLQRGGERLAVYLPRGPLGLRIDGTRERPQPVR